MTGIIVKGIGGFYYIKIDDKIIECKARGKFRYNGLTPMVGDRVDIIVKDNKGTIEAIKERKSELIRPAVSNITQAFVVFAFRNPNINTNLLNKFLILCEYHNIKAVVCLNKKDLATEEDKKIIDTIKNAGYNIVLLEAKNEVGINELKSRLNDNLTVFCGPSGVGKSTIFNKLVGKELMETGNISEKLKRGKHTTRHSELIEIENGFLVDTPGFSTLDISFIKKDELRDLFPEFRKYQNSCKFSTCMHHKEPNCSVKAALENNEIAKDRYEFYIKTIEELNNGRNKR